MLGVPSETLPKWSDSLSQWCSGQFFGSYNHAKRGKHLSASFSFQLHSFMVFEPRKRMYPVLPPLHSWILPEITHTIWCLCMTVGVWWWANHHVFNKCCSVCLGDRLFRLHRKCQETSLSGDVERQQSYDWSPHFKCIVNKLEGNLEWLPDVINRKIQCCGLTPTDCSCRL